MVMPNFLIIGAAKAGTTSLYHYLSEHPQVFMSPIKELNYFAYDDPDVHSGWPDLPFPIKSIEDYCAQFSAVKSETAVGEASPIYLESAIAPKRIKEIIPNVKLIAALRNPADRAYSGYLMHILHGQENNSIDKAFNMNARYVRGGFYYSKLKRFYDVFDQSQIKVCYFEDLKNYPVKLIHELYSFLEVDNNFTPDLYKKHNVGRYPRNKLINKIIAHGVKWRLASHLPNWVRAAGKKVRTRNFTKPPPFPSELKAKLINLYRDDIMRLQDLVDRDLSMWIEQ